MNPAPRWQRPPDDTLVWRQLGDAHFAYHVASGQTHFLNELGAWVVARLERAGATEAELCAELVRAFDAESSAELEQAVTATVQVLSRLGLIECDSAAVL